MPEPVSFIVQLFGNNPRRDPAREEATRRLWAMTADERRAAMYAGTLPLRHSLEWASRAPQEVPQLNGEFWFIAIHTPEAADCGELAAAPARTAQP